MRIIFCADPMNINKADIDYEEEFETAKQTGFDVDIIGLEDLLDGNVKRSLRRIPDGIQDQLAIYRGWMIKPEIYKNLYNNLAQKGICLINTPEEYAFCHYLPLCYEAIKDITPKTIWIEKDKLIESKEAIYSAIKIFGSSPVIIKDYVKSCKHKWDEACFIQDASDKVKLDSVINNFLNYRGSELEGGIVIREYKQLEFLTRHPKSGMPLSKEFRLLFFNNKLLAQYNYWDEGSYNEDLKSSDIIESFKIIGEKIKSKFFTMDVAKTKNGDWIIIELGDGQVSGLPNNADIKEFYEKLNKAFING